MEERKSYREELSLGDLLIDEDFWGEGSTPIVQRWMLENYDQATMPTLQCVTMKGREGIYLMGWKTEGLHESWPSLLHLIFGNAYADKQLAKVKANTELMIRMKAEQHPEYGVGKKKEQG